MKQLTSIEDFNEVLELFPNLIIYKHSPSCSICAKAIIEIQHAESEIDIENIFLVDVLSDRELSNYIEEKTNIKHESPQIIFFRKGKPGKHASHLTISKGYVIHTLHRWVK